MGSGTRAKLLLLGSLYTTQFLAIGFFIAALPTILREQGVPLQRRLAENEILNEYMLHGGSFGRPPVQVLYAFVGLAPLVFGYSRSNGPKPKHKETR